MRLIQERGEGQIVPQGLSVTRLPSGYRRYILRLGDVKAWISFPKAEDRICRMIVAAETVKKGPIFEVMFV